MNFIRYLITNNKTQQKIYSSSFIEDVTKFDKEFILFIYYLMYYNKEILLCCAGII